MGEKPCKRGHTPHKRRTRNGNCCQCEIDRVISLRTMKSKDAPIGRKNVKEEDLLISKDETYKEMCKRVYKRDMSW